MVGLISDKVFSQLLDNIVSERWPEGHQIPGERVLAIQFAVSRLAVREALARLKGMGLVAGAQGRVSRVAHPGIASFAKTLPLLISKIHRADFAAFFQFRLAIETRSAALAARNRTKKDLSRLGSLLASARLATNEDSLRQSDFDFHLGVAKASGNALIALVVELFYPFYSNSMSLSCQCIPSRLRAAQQFHAAIFEAIDAKKPDFAAAEMEKHIVESAGHFLQTAVH